MGVMYGSLESDVRLSFLTDVEENVTKADRAISNLAFGFFLGVRPRPSSGVPLG